LEALEHLSEEINHLLFSLTSLTIAGKAYSTSDFAVTTYLFWLMVSILILSGVMFLAVRRLKLVPESKLSNGVEALAQFVRDDIAAAIIGHDSKKYFPFIATIFFFIFTNTLLGLIPGARPGVGTMGVTVALSTTVFIYFNAVGIKAQGVWGYIKSFAPAGVPFPINLIVWAIEVFSAFLRIFTLAVRLFANMFAGHIVLGIFAILTGLFAEQLIHDLSVSGFVSALPALGWLALMTGLYLLEVLVAFVQAYVFTLLTAVYIGLAVHEH